MGLAFCARCRLPRCQLASLSSYNPLDRHTPVMVDTTLQEVDNAPPLTTRQREVLEFVRQFHGQGWLPAHGARDRPALRLVPRSIFDHLKALERRVPSGADQQNPDPSRSWSPHRRHSAFRNPKSAIYRETPRSWVASPPGMPLLSTRTSKGRPSSHRIG